MQPSQDGSPPLIVFLHNYRTAGTTLRSIINFQYEGGAIYNPGPNFSQLSKIEELEDPRISMIEGHIPFGIHKFTSRPCTYITILRRPVERVISFYYWLQEREAKDPTKKTKWRLPTNLSDFVASGLWKDVDNGQTRRISGIDPGFGQCTQETLEVARENLQNRFSVVGLTERFDETLLLLRRAFGWKYLAHTAVKARTTLRPNSMPSGDVRREIAKLNELDNELYCYAETLFEEAIGKDSPRYQLELEAFRRANGKDTDGEYALEEGIASDDRATLLNAYLDLFKQQREAYFAFARREEEIRRLRKIQARDKRNIEQLQARESQLLAELEQLRSGAPGAPRR